MEAGTRTHHDRGVDGSADAVAVDSIRVDVDLLDGLMNLVGELVLARNQILQFAQRAQHSALLATSQRLNLVTTELQANVMRTRMQPLQHVFQQMPRIVRDGAIARGIQIHLETFGGHTELDRNLLETARRPVLELVRHLVARGIASADGPSGRSGRAGAETTISVAASRSGGQVVIDIVHDGPVERGPADDLPAELADMSAVVESVGGKLENVETESGVGFRVKLPLTLAIIPALILHCGHERYAVSQGNLLEVVRIDCLDESTVEWIGPTPVYRLRGALLPLVMLNDIIGCDRPAPKGPASIVVLDADGRRFGLVTDDVGDTVEIVVKPLRSHLKQAVVFTGATILGDGSVALILDPAGIAHHLRMASQRDAERQARTTSESAGLEADENLLLVEAGGSRYAVPVARIARVEELPARRIEVATAGLVMQHESTVIRLRPLADVLGRPAAQHDGEADRRLIVFHCAGEPFALIVDDVEDIVAGGRAISRAAAVTGTIGATVVDGDIVDVVDIDHVFRAMSASAAI